MNVGFKGHDSIESRRAEIETNLCMIGLGLLLLSSCRIKQILFLCHTLFSNRLALFPVCRNQ